MGRCRGEENEIWEGGSLGFGKVFGDRGSVWQIQLLYFWSTSGKDTLSVVQYLLDELQALL